MSTSKLFIVIFLSAVMGGVAAVMGMNYLVLGKAIDGFKIPTREASAVNKQNEGQSSTDSSSVNGAQSQFISSGLGGTLPASREEEIVENIYQRLSPAVVHITTRQEVYDFWRGVLVPQEGTGSGVLIDSNGLILTNNHVIEPALTQKGQLFVTYPNGESEEATIVGTDAISDVAVIKLKNKPNVNFPTAKLGDSDKIRVGAMAVAIGNPFGLDGTCTVGIISALNRTIKVDEQEIEGMIQTDATINPGNSGGPLINSSGEVIGITSIILSRSGGSEGLGFAIPINEAKKIMTDLMKFGKVRRPYLGASTFPVVPILTTYLNLPVKEGLLVQQVEFGSPAYKAGLKAGDQLVGFRNYRIYVGGDIILALNGEKTKNPMEFDKAIRKMEIGDKIVLDVMRGNKKIKVDVTLEAKP